MYLFIFLSYFLSRVDENLAISYYTPFSDRHMLNPYICNNHYNICLIKNLGSVNYSRKNVCISSLNKPIKSRQIICYVIFIHPLN